MKFSHTSLICIAGFLWFAIGSILLPFGLHLIMSEVKPQIITLENHTPLLNFFSSLSKGKENGAILLISLGLFIGYMKGKYVLAKSARRAIGRILNFPNPTNISNLYSRSFYLLIGLMICIGMMMKWFVPIDVRGFIDVAVGSALINGAMIYFRAAINSRKKSPTPA